MPARRARKAGGFDFKWTVVPDRVDLRDRPYQPHVTDAPPARIDSLAKVRLPVLHQRETSACTGFALASVVNFLLHRAKRGQEAGVAPFMLYSMARRYDEFPGASEDSGSSLRGAMKGWHKHGACAASLWRGLDIPKPRRDPARDWWQDAARRPLGAYYRVDTRSVTDMHVALSETGVLYASAVCHGGWFEPEARRGLPRIRQRPANPDDGGHAFVIVGYDDEGFLVLNSWGEEWGRRGVALLAYEDWLENAMDCWVAQLGVVTAQHRAVSASATLRLTAAGTVELASDRELRNHEIAPYVVDMENNGALSASGDFRTSEDDLRSLVTDRIAAARKDWSVGPSEPLDIAVYAHGGLTGEETAARTAAAWIPALYAARIFPIFLMWETDIWSTLKGGLADRLEAMPRLTRGPLSNLDRWWSKRLEQTLAGPGTAIWGEMKQNAEAISGNARAGKDGSGARLLFDIGTKTGAFAPGRVRLHLIGHSAGSIVHCHAVDQLVKAGYVFASVTFMAPAVRLDTFERTLGRALAKGLVHRLHEIHLSDEAEVRDSTCRPILGYDRSLLYLVSESFEGGARTPILGMERYFTPWAGSRPNVTVTVAPSGASASTTHGGFDEDEATRRTVIRVIKEAAVSAAAAAPPPRAGRRPKRRARRAA